MARAARARAGASSISAATTTTRRGTGCAAVSLMALLALLLAAPGAQAATQLSVPLAGSARGATVYGASRDALAGPQGSRTLMLFLRGISCAFSPVQLASVPGVAQVFASRTNFGEGGGGLADDVGAMAASAADSLGVVAAVLTPPRVTRTCKLCPSAAAAASAAAQSNPEKEFTLVGAALLANATASGPTCLAWDASQACCQSTHASPRGDTDFILSAIDAIAAQAPAANRSGVVALGFSNGAFMVQTLACNAPAGRIAGIVAYAGGAVDTCNAPAPVSVIIAHGLNDLEVPVGGSPAGTPPGAARHVGAAAALAGWAGRNRCSSSPQRSQTSLGALGGSGGGEVDVVAYQNCAAGVLTQGWLVRDWGHLPPRGNNAVFLAAAKRLLGRG